MLKAELKLYAGMDIQLAGGDGCSLDEAFIIHSQPGFRLYDMEERIQDYLKQKYCLKQQLVRQELLSKGGRIYDHFVYECEYKPETPDGIDLSNLYFDITECQNRMF